MLAIAKQPTKLTKDFADSSAIADPARIFEVPEGWECGVRAISPQVQNGKRLVTLKRGVGPKNYNTWFFYPDHWTVDGTPRGDFPEAIEPKAADESSVHKHKFSIITRDKIDWSEPGCPISEFFTAGEVTQNDPRRIPRDAGVEGRIIAIALELDKLREEWGSSIGCTSWYRPAAINREVGGASQSQHITGGAVDVFAHNGNDYRFEDFLDAHWGGGLGYGVASGRGFTHLDLREGGWRRGPGTIRWTY